MPGDDVYELYIDAFTPATISMARLADYMRDFAEMLGHPGAKVIEFAGRNRMVEKSTGPIEQADTLVGAVIQIGGRDETINIHLKMGDDVFSHCVTSKAVARRLAHHLFGPPIRLRGTGVWSRADSGAWRLHRFSVDDFEPLDATPLPMLFQNLRAKLGAEGRGNPILFLQELREE